MNWKNAIMALALILALGFLIWTLVEKNRNAELTRDLNRLRNSSNQTSDQLTEARRQLDRAESRVSELERANQQLQSTQTDLEGKLAAARRETASLSQEVSALTSDGTSAKVELEKQRQAAESAAEELADSGKRLAELEKRLAELEAEPRPEAEDQARAAAEFHSQIEALTADLNRAQAENELLRQEAADVDRAKELLRQESAAAGRELEAARLRLEELEAAPRPDPGEQAAAQSRLEDLNRRLEQALAEIERLKKELAEAPAPCPPAGPAEDEADPGLQSELEGLRRELEAGRQALLASQIGSKTARLTAAAELKTQTAALARLQEELVRAAETEQEARARLTDCRRLAAEQQARTERLEADRERLQAEKRALKNDLAAVFVDQLLFTSGSVTLSPAGRQALDAAARVVNQAPERTVLVVGHSDDQPPNRALSRRYPSNWELSAARAAAVIRYLTEQGGVDPVRLSLVGRSQHQPAAPNETEENRRSNRRVEIIISNHLQPVTAAP